MSDHARPCPGCGADLDGGSMMKSEGGPLADDVVRGCYSPPYRWGREIMLVDRDRDRVTAWECPDCGGQFGLDVLPAKR